MRLFFYSEKTKKQYILVPICNNHVFYPQGLFSHDHFHPVYHLVFVLQGQGSLSTRQKDYLIKEKDIFIVNPNEKHIYSSNEPEGMTHFTVNFYLVTLENYQTLDAKRFWSQITDKKRIEPWAETMNFEDIFEFSMEEIFFTFDQTRWTEISILIETFCASINKIVKSPYYIISEKLKHPLLLSGHFSKFITTFFDFVSGPFMQSSHTFINDNHFLLNKIIYYLNDSVHDSFQLSKLALSLNYSPVYLCTYFKQKTGLTITQYLNKLRINKACEYLRVSNKTITEIASILNFSSSNHFSNSFKKEKMVSPKDYRKHPEML